jgi:two-component system NtrC family sensor kinase
VNQEPFILYVDDERANRVVFEVAFKQRFPVRCVDSGEAALEVLAQDKVAVLVTDQRMPGMSGHELLEKAREKYPDVVRIIITAYGEMDLILRAVNEGLVSRYLVKPWDRKELEQVLAWAIEASQLAGRDSALQLRLMETERLITIGSISSAVLHDLQQPISSVGLNVDRLAEHTTAMATLRGELSEATMARPEIAIAFEEMPELAEDLRLASKVMQGIVEHLRTFLRPVAAPSDGVPVDPVTEPLTIIRYAMTVCRTAAVKKQCQVSYKGPATLPPVKIGMTELTQVLINLLSNAVQALATGGAAVVEVSETETHLAVSVADNGAGMPPEVVRKAGTVFFTTKATGTGLGLSQCRRILGAVGAQLEIDSKVGVGTTMRFLLPIAKAAQKSA